MESWLKVNGCNLDQVYHPVWELPENMEWQYQYCQLLHFTLQNGTTGTAAIDVQEESLKENSRRQHESKAYDENE